MVSQYFFCPLGCLHKFVISFATQYVFARVAPVPEKTLPLTYTHTAYERSCYYLFIHPLPMFSASRLAICCVWGCRHNSWLIPPVCRMTAPALCATFPTVIFLSTPSNGTRSHVHSYLSPVA